MPVSSLRAISSLLLGPCLLAIIPGLATAQTPAAPITLPALTQPTVPIGGVWQFHLGDDLAWSSPTLDDSAWQPISTDARWGAQTKFPNHFAYTGFAWYRRHIDIPASSTDLGLYVPHVDDAFEVYWNGALIGAYGQLPPHPVHYFAQPPHTFLLGPARAGVLAMRVWKGPVESFATGEEGGLAGPPRIGSTVAIDLLKANSDYTWLHGRQFFLALNLLYFVVAVMALLTWLNDRSQKVLFWISLFAISPVVRMLLLTLRNSLPYALTLGGSQPFYATSDIALWFILLYLLKLDSSPRLNRLTRVVAWVSIISTCLDGLLSAPVFATPQMQRTFVLGDAILTAIFTSLELYTLVLVAAVIVLRRRLDLTRWIVAAFAFLVEGLGALVIALEQGRRFTHWTIDVKLSAPLFTLRGNFFSLQTIFATALFISIVYAVSRFIEDNARQQLALQREFLSAQELQRVLVPESLPALPGYAIASSYIPAREVGGDFFQLLPQPGGAALLLIGDVSGKGLKAAMTVSLIIGTARTLAEFIPDPAQILTGLNRRLHGRLSGGFVTCQILRLESSGECSISSAGHLPPIVNGVELDLPPALPLGLLPEDNYQSTFLHLAIGDRLTLYTDGLLEARDIRGQLLGFDRVRALAASGSTAAEASQAAVDFGQDDDITVLTLTRLNVGIAPTTSLSAPTLIGA